MLSRHIVRLAQTPRSAARVMAVRFYNPEQKGDTGHQANQAGFSATDSRKASPVDAASAEKGKKASHGHVGNKEGLGFADQVGSQSSTASALTEGKGRAARTEGVSGEENITPPSFFDAVKSKLGFETTAGEDKQNRGGGVGVTGTGQVTGKRNMHTSASVRADQTQGQAPQASREPKESTNAGQNAHLKHKSSSSPDTGKGNAAQEPTLPSKQRANASTSQQRRGFSTSARTAEEKHTTDTYSKEVDSNKPMNPKVHQVDSSAGGAPVARANEKSGTGDFSQKGPESPEYETMSKHDQPYDVPPTRGPEKGEKSRYGGQSGVNQERPSQSDEGPAGKDAGGRKPEGRS